MLLDLNTIHAPRERYEKVYPPEAFSAEGEAFRVVGPVSLAFDIVKDKQQFQLIGTVTTTLELPCSRCLEPFTWPVDGRIRSAVSAAHAECGRGRARDRRRRSHDGVLRERGDRSRSADAGAVLPVAADEAAVPYRVPRAVPDLRDESEPRHVRLQARLGRSAACGAENLEEGVKRYHRGHGNKRRSLFIWIGFVSSVFLRFLRGRVFDE